MAPAWEVLESMLGLTADWAWECDTEYRFSRLGGNVPEHALGADASALVGYTPWELGFHPAATNGDSDEYRRLLDARKPFRSVLLRRNAADRQTWFLRISGAPSYDEQGRWTGYRGLGENVTEARERHLGAQRLHAIMDVSPDCIFVADAETQRFIYVNDTACTVTGFSREELMNIYGRDLMGRTREQMFETYEHVIAAGADGLTDQVHWAQSKDGQRHGWWEPHHRAVQLEGRWMIITVSREVSQRIMAERAVERGRRMYAALGATNEAIMHAATPDELYQGVCDAAVDAGGLASATVLLQDEGTGELHPAAIAGGGKREIHRAFISVASSVPEGHGLNGAAFRSGETQISNDFLNDPRTAPWHGIAGEMRLKAGAAIPIVHDGRSIGVFFLCAGERRTFDEEVVQLLRRMMDNLVFGLQNLEHELDRERAEARAHFLATHDSLTGLPNRVLFGELLGQATTTARRYGRSPAVMFIDLDRFKLVNDTLGHAAGDVLLKEMAARLRGALRESDVLARLGGDEFVILLQDVKQHEDAAVVGRKLLEATIPPITIMGQECRVTASIGISVYPDHGDEHQELMKNADTAMYLAKEQGKNAFVFFEYGMQSQANERLALEAALRTALENEELAVHYQPKLDLDSGRINGVEALLRWHHPTMGNIPPQQFLPLAEENGAIIAIGRWVLRTACQQSMAWQREGLPPVTIAVNLSARQLAEQNLIEDVSTALAETGLEPSLLELEMAESMVMLNPLKTAEALRDLRRLGVKIAIDDFGVGYSSLAQIKDFAVDTLKVDRSFIRNLPGSGQDRAITEAIIAMARNLNLRVVAEGVETADQEDYLRGLTCNETQGFHFSRPAPAAELTDLLRRQGFPSPGPDE